MTLWATNRWLRFRVLNPGEERARSLLEESHPLRRLGLVTSRNDWTISSQTRLLLYHMVETTQPRRIIECGSGTSTIIFADYAARHDQGGRPAPLIWSIDHDGHWMEATRKSLEERGLAKYVRLVHAPIDERLVFGKSMQGYRLPPSVRAELAAAEAFDFCLIDGPPHTVGRFASLPTVAGYLAPGAVVLLDDAFRPDEQAAWKLWREHYPKSLVHSRLILTHRGMAMGRWYPRDLAGLQASSGEPMAAGTAHS